MYLSDCQTNKTSRWFLGGSGGAASSEIHHGLIGHETRNVDFRVPLAASTYKFGRQGFDFYLDSIGPGARLERQSPI